MLRAAFLRCRETATCKMARSAYDGFSVQSDSSHVRRPCWSLPRKPVLPMFRILQPSKAHQLHDYGYGVICLCPPAQWLLGAGLDAGGQQGSQVGRVGGPHATQYFSHGGRECREAILAGRSIDCIGLALEG